MTPEERLEKIKDYCIEFREKRHLKNHQNDDYVDNKDCFLAGVDKGFAQALTQVLSFFR